MAQRISGMQDFRNRFNEKKHKSDLFAYFLFDARSSHDNVADFAEQEFKWLDSLAAAAKMFFFIFIRPECDADKAVNPGPQIAKMFGIHPDQLPGIVLFILSADGENVGDAAFLPISAQLFENNHAKVEEILAELFSIIHKCRARTETPEKLLKEISIEIERSRREEARKPIWTYLKGNLVAVLDFPKAVLDATAQAIGTAVAKSWVNP